MKAIRKITLNQTLTFSNGSANMNLNELDSYYDSFHFCRKYDLIIQFNNFGKRT